MIPRALLLLSVALLAGCGGGSEEPDRPRTTPPAASGSAEAVVRAWAAELRRGDVEAATDRFAVPAIVTNFGPEERLETREQVRSFNATLPCGGRVVESERHYGYVIATFVLTERPGADCDGTGDRARTAFQVRDGKIVRWVRVPLEGETPAPPPDVV